MELLKLLGWVVVQIILRPLAKYVLVPVGYILIIGGGIALMWKWPVLFIFWLILFGYGLVQRFS